MIKTYDDREAQRLRVQAELDSERSARERNEAGQFATPPALAAEVAQVALGLLGEERSIRFLDPALGSGALFSAVLRLSGATRIESAQGFELDERFVKLALAVWGHTGLVVTHEDFTRCKPPSRPSELANLIIANPPYVRHHHLGQDDKVRLRLASQEVLGAPVSGLSGLYVHFMLMSHAWLANNGVSAWILPSEWMDVNYGEALRTYLRERVHLLRIHRFAATDVQFGDALVSSSVVFFRKQGGQEENLCLFTSGGTLTRPAQSHAVHRAELRGSEKWSQLFAGTKATSSTASAQRVPLGDMLRVTRGIATGANEFFIRPRAEFRRLGIPDRFLRPVVPSSRVLTSDVIERGQDGFPAFGEPLALLDCPLPETLVREEHPALWAYLESEAGQQARAGYLTQKRKPWYAQEQRPPAPFLATYMGRGRSGGCPFRFFWNRSDATATNGFLLLIPSGRLASALEHDPLAGRVVLDFLNGVAAEELVGLGRVYGGGLHKLEPRELANLDVTTLIASLGWTTEPRDAQLRLALDVGTSPRRGGLRRPPGAVQI